MKHETHFDGTAPNTDAERVSTAGVASPESAVRVTGKLGKFLDLLDSEMAEHWAQKSAD